MATETKRPRKPRTNYQAQHDKLVNWCKISIDVIGVLLPTADESMKEFFRGQSDALKAVLRQLGAGEDI